MCCVLRGIFLVDDIVSALTPHGIRDGFSLAGCCVLGS